jgi:hypothetical protein
MSQMLRPIRYSSTCVFVLTAITRFVEFISIISNRPAARTHTGRQEALIKQPQAFADARRQGRLYSPTALEDVKQDIRFYRSDRHSCGCLPALPRQCLKFNVLILYRLSTISFYIPAFGLRPLALTIAVKPFILGQFSSFTYPTTQRPDRNARCSAKLNWVHFLLFRRPISGFRMI